MKEALKRLVKKTPILPLLRKAKRKLSNVELHPLQTLKTVPGFALKTLGTPYGGWTFVDTPSLKSATIISAGLGEDASFDVEFATHYDATVLLVDPTPRAIAHFNAMVNRFGETNSRGYSYTGKEPVEAYNLTGISATNLKLIPKALWKETTTLKFYEPTNPDHVSHSIVNFQNNYREDTSHIEVEALPVTTLLNQLDIKQENVELIKLDIEGAEIEVIEEFLDSGFCPKQILAEFDELNKPSERAFNRVDSIHKKLEETGYQCIHTDGDTSFLYILKSAF